MFRAQANPMDDAVVKATDENLTSENWAYILDVCDRVGANSTGPSLAVSSLIKRLAHRNANVQLYTLELANALLQNCGVALHRELASKAFTDALLRLAGDRNTHAQVKQKVYERMSSWAEDFGSNPDLGIMGQAFQSLKRQQPGLMPPSKPHKREISSEDKRKEEEELQMALALSVKDKGPVTNGATGEHSARTSSTSGPPSQAQQQGTTAATVSRVRALYDFAPSEPGELAFRRGDIIAVLESVYKDWWKGSLRGNTGIFPLNYVEKLQDPTKDELEKDAQMEGEVFAEIKNVEKLLALLSVRGEGGAGRRGDREEDEISELYQRTLSIRPKLIELIGKYSQKKDDFTQLNEKFIKARHDYEALLESSMSQPQFQQQMPYRGPRQPSGGYTQPQYGGPSQGYPQQHPGYPPPAQSPFQPQHSQQHLPLQTPEPHVYHAPSHPMQAQQPYSGPQYAPSDAPSTTSTPAPFHFIPGGLAAVHSPAPQGPPPQSQPIRRKTPTQPSHSHSGDSHGSQQQGGFQGQIRPNSVHTLNSGYPSELASGAYETPVTTHAPQQHGYETQSAPPQQQQQQNVAQYTTGQTTASPVSQHYPPPPQQQQLPPQAPFTNHHHHQQQQQQQQSAQEPPSVHAPPPQHIPSGPPSQQGPPSPTQQQQPQQQPQQQAYQPYAPYAGQYAAPPQQQQQRTPSIASTGGTGDDDASSFYR